MNLVRHVHMAQCCWLPNSCSELLRGWPGFVFQAPWMPLIKAAFTKHYKRCTAHPDRWGNKMAAPSSSPCASSLIGFKSGAAQGMCGDCDLVSKETYWCCDSPQSAWVLFQCNCSWTAGAVAEWPVGLYCLLPIGSEVWRKRKRVVYLKAIQFCNNWQVSASDSCFL